MSRTIVPRPSDAGRAVIVMTVVTGAVVALAQVIEGPVVLAVVLVVAVVWFATPIVGVVALVASRWTWRRPSGLAVVGVVAAMIGTAHLALLGIVRLAEGRDALVWNVDWRYHLNHAQSIAQHADLDTALDYAGAGITYHVGPAWISGAFGYFFHGGIEVVAFLAVPVMTGVATFVSGAYLCMRLGASRRIAAAAAGILLVLPTYFFDATQLFDPPYLRTPDAYLFSARFLLNGQLGWAVGLSAVALVMSRRTTLATVGVVGLALLPILKPQHFVGFLVVAIVCAAALADRERERATWVRLGVVAVAGGAVTALVGAAEEGLGGVTFEPGATGLSLRAYLGIPALVAAASAVALLASRAARRTPTLRVSAALGVFALLGVVALSIVAFPVSAFELEQLTGIGFRAAARFHQADYAEVLVPILLVATLCGLAGFAALLERAQWGHRVVLVAASVAILLVVPIIVTSARHPTGGAAQESVEDVGLLRVLDAIPRDGTMLLASDLADPADGHVRGLRAPLLSGYRGHQNFVSNLHYLNFEEPDAPERLRSVQRFFGSSTFTPWNAEFLRRNGITHVLIDDRCPPHWDLWPAQLERVASSGAWTVARVRRDALDDSGDGAPDPPRSRPVKAEYGAMTCLTPAAAS